MKCCRSVVHLPGLWQAAQVDSACGVWPGLTCQVVGNYSFVTSMCAFQMDVCWKSITRPIHCRDLQDEREHGMSGSLPVTFGNMSLLTYLTLPSMSGPFPPNLANHLVTLCVFDFWTRPASL